MTETFFTVALIFWAITQMFFNFTVITAFKKQREFNEATLNTLRLTGEILKEFERVLKPTRPPRK